MATYKMKTAIITGIILATLAGIISAIVTIIIVQNIGALTYLI